jgi:hypothetical protein
VISLLPSETTESAVALLKPGAHACQIYLIIQALASFPDAALRLLTIDDDVGVRDPQLMPVCAAICIASPRPSSSIVRPTAAPSSLSAPRSMTFDALMHRPIAHLYVLTGALCVHNLSAVECALWASAVEHLSSSS